MLGLIREGDGVAAQVLVLLGADLNQLRQQVLQRLQGFQGEGELSLRAVQRPGLLGLSMPWRSACRSLSDEIERLRDLLRQHGIDPQGGAA